MSDLIKRSDAIKDLCDISNNSDMPEDWHRGLSVAISALYRVPSADRPQGEWIPCSERLPDEDGQYLVWAVIGIVPDHVDDPSTYQGITIAGYYGNAHPIKWFGHVEKVLAWMPLPEPWKGADDE